MALYTSGYGQTYFYFQSKLQTADHRPLAYDIFLNIGIDGTASARIAFKDPVTGKNRLVKQNYIDNDFPDRSDTDKVTYLMPFGDAFGEDDSPEKGFITPRFQFEKPENVFFLGGAMAKVYYSYNHLQWFLPASDSVQLKNISDLTAQKTFVNRFYSKDDSFYKYLFNVSTRRLTANETNRNMFLLVIAATDDPKIGASTQLDLQNISALFPGNSSQFRLNFQYKEITGKNFTKKIVNNAIDSLKPGPKDIVIVYYSGHGFRYNDDVSEFPRMALVANPDQNPDDANLSLEDIYNRILKKHAKVSIVLADCCNENYGESPPKGPVGQIVAAAPGAPPKMNLDNFRALFIPKHPLTVLACAAGKNQLAAGNDHLGGFFTNFVISELNKNFYDSWGGGEASWARMLNNIKEYTRRQALTVPCKAGPCDGDSNLQRAEFKVNVTSNSKAQNEKK